MGPFCCSTYHLVIKSPQCSSKNFLYSYIYVTAFLLSLFVGNVLQELESVSRTTKLEVSFIGSLATD